MRIAMISEHASPLAALGGVDAGGQNVHVAALAEAHGRQGNHVTVYTRRDDPDLPERVRVNDAVDVVHINAGPAHDISKDDLLPYMGDLARGVIDDADRVRPHILHSHFWMSGLAAIAAARALGIPVVHTFHALGVVKRRHQGASDTSPPERQWLEPRVGQTVDGIIATCSDEVFELKALGVPTDRISIAPCGVDLDEFRPTGRRLRKGRRHRVVTIGRLVPRKGFETLIDALAHMNRDDVELVIVGGPGGEQETREDAEAKRLIAHAKDLGVAEQVILTGQLTRREMPSMIRSADIVACTPWYEPFGIVPLEAMACGVPVVATAVGGLTDTVVEALTGRLVPPDDPGYLARVLTRMLADPEKLARYGNNGRRRVEQRYSWGTVARTTEETYRRICAAQERGTNMRTAR